jgi:hypothetical protein
MVVSIFLTQVYRYLRTPILNEIEVRIKMCACIEATLGVVVI